jgi:hypothetical protein
MFFMTALEVEYFIDIFSFIILRPITGMSCKAATESGRNSVLYISRGSLLRQTESTFCTCIILSRQESNQTTMKERQTGPVDKIREKRRGVTWEW